MPKTILITGSTDGIGLQAAQKIVALGHTVLLHGRNKAKLAEAEQQVKDFSDQGSVETYLADLATMSGAMDLANDIKQKHRHLDVLINNAGVFRAPCSITEEGFDIRFMVNTIAPCFLTKQLLSLLDHSARVVNLSSAAQAPINLQALQGKVTLADEMEAYAQSKLAITMWSKQMADEFADGPGFIAVNPGSLLATKMVKQGFGMPGKDIQIGVDILLQAALSDTFSDVSGNYFDNDLGQFASPHQDALDAEKNQALVMALEQVVAEHISLS